ncbi:FAD-dependent oxidoreductase [Salegentibacter sp. F188]|uniref:FAD-dependent oxidoreductase n=1 Tax=Autumnicola patrickiae TaxID=3075591 RepID=A0ABU3DZ60_9FLAO|nr:FAD-dependent oxidoreductase [Salegentibacter sp. F188]MDT0689002.1 FAD-dependent oxidoreductase [Salegentibacter sp. F188]
MLKKSLWSSFATNPLKYPKLEGDIAVDVAIIGGGITGITTAQTLTERGFKVAVLEARSVGYGTTGHSTGNLYIIIDELLSSLKSKYDNDVVMRVIESRKSALEKIEENVEKFNIDCDFSRQPLYLYEDVNNIILEEIKVAEEINLAFTELAEDFPFEQDNGIHFDHQAQFNPLLYVLGLAASLDKEKCSIYENTTVRSVEEQADRVLVNTDDAIVAAKYVVHATHTPKGLELQYHTTLGPYREYGVAAKLESTSYPQGIFWGYYNNQKYSIRSYSRDGEKYLIAVGSPHKVGQAENNRKHVEDLVNFLQDRFIVGQITYTWGGQNYKPADLLPYIGRKIKNSREFIATGFSTDGLIYGTLSAMIIADKIEDKFNRFEDLYEAARHQPVKSAKKFVKENANVAGEFLKDLSFKGDDKDLLEIMPGEAAIITRNGEKAGVYRQQNGELKVVSALCTHMACMVHWNNLEESWDCPCHGSRFDTSGEVIEGPAYHPLPKKIIEK